MVARNATLLGLLALQTCLVLLHFLLCPLYSPVALRSSLLPPAEMTAAERKPNVIYTKDLYTGVLLVPHAERCPQLGARVLVLVLVTTAPAHRAAREAVRLTWGHARLRSDVAMAFVIGRPPDHLSASLLEEDGIYEDLIVGDFVDSYSNLTLKTLSMLQWARAYCPGARFLFKTDDDMFINLPRLIKFVKSKANATRTIFGRMLKKAHPVRAVKSKAYIPATQYPYKELPDFINGGAYLLTTDLARQMLVASDTQPFIGPEDVYVTGILADAVGARRQHADDFYYERIPVDTCKFHRAVSIHKMVQNGKVFDLWRRLFTDDVKNCSEA